MSVKTVVGVALPNKRVEVPAYTDAWIQGDRYGEVMGERTRLLRGHTTRQKAYAVRMDNSGRLLEFAAKDCTEV